LSSIFGTEASADSSTANQNPVTQNSQNINILQANTSPVLVSMKDKTQESKTDTIDPNSNVNILSDNALLPASGAMDALGGDNNYDPSLEQGISVYVVHQGDTVEIVAKLFDVSPDTIYSANDLKKGDKLKEGDILLILPFSGVEHVVAKGETLKNIANKYKVDLNDILSANDLTIDDNLIVGEKIMVPGGNMPTISKPKNNGIARKGEYSSNVPSLFDYFINPVPGYHKSQGLHDGNAVDLAIAKGTPIHAAASGVVTFARMGYNGGFGGLVIISHPNGTQTYYAHQSQILTSVGAQVSQGEIIGKVGSTGRSTGPHLHFAVKGVRNPGVNDSWKPWSY
jgi:murein DD-endopeptidase MepM/ murein hydrolase activator NlpD